MSATNVQALVELAGRVEAAVPSDWRALRTLAKDIYRTLNVLPKLVTGGYGWTEDDSGWWLATGEDQRCPRKRIDPPNWLTSVDAAVTLIPSGKWSITAMAGIGWQAFAWPQGSHREPEWSSGATPALALVNSALLARAAIEGEG